MTIVMKHYRTKKQSGATLIEALVSILVMSLGLLGLAALQLNALSFQKSSWATHRISELVIDASERIRANPRGVYTFANTYAAAAATTGAPTPNNCRNSGADCTISQIINDDLSALATKAQTTLPGGAIRIDNLEPAGIVVTAMYRDKDFVNAAGVPQPSLVCAAATAGVAWRNCCPAAAAVPNGVRCSRMDILP